MLHSDFLKDHTLHRQIKAVKVELIQNKQALLVQSNVFTRKIYLQLTAPATLFFAGFSGFLFAEFNHHPAQKHQHQSNIECNTESNPTHMGPLGHSQVANDQTTNKKHGDESSNSGKALSQQWSLANINQLLISSTHIMTLVNSSLLCLREINQHKVQKPEKFTSEKSTLAEDSQA